ncbi:unnamed protein product [Gadus morhua 'NCC']
MLFEAPRWSHAVQVNLKSKMVSVGTQTSFSPQTSTPLASPEQTVDDDDDNATVISDLSWVPEEPMDEEELFDEETPYTCDPHHNCIDKFNVCQEELMGLFAICPACCERSDSSIVQQEGTFVKIKQVCASCGYHRFWQNQPMLHRNMPTCNLHTDTKNVDPVWPAVHQCEQFLSPSAPLHHPCNRSSLAE